MRVDKNILKGNRFADLKTVKKRNFYVVMTIDKKDVVVTFEGTRIDAKNYFDAVAKANKGKITTPVLSLRK